MAVLAVPLFFSACSAPGELVKSPPPGMVQVQAQLPRGGLLDCGPEVLSAILALNGKAADVSAISDEICEKTRGGTNPLQMAAFAAKNGLRTRAAPGCPDETLLAALNQGIPAICMVQSGPSFHYYLVVGARPGEIVCADYAGAVRLFTREDFNVFWNRTHRYTLFIAPDVSHIPYTEDDYLRKLDKPPFPPEFLDGRTHFLVGTDYEQRGFAKLAKIEYERAIDADSSQVGAALALGNLQFADGEFDEALKTFRRGAHAGGSCANNLAFLLSEHFGRPSDAWPFAVDAEKQSVRRSDPWFESLDTQGVVGLRLGRFAEAEAAWLRGAAEAGEDRRAYRARCWAGAAKAAIAQGKKDTAAERLAKAEKDGVEEALAAEIRELLKP